MKVAWLDDVRPRERRVALGQFDGVHLGHRRLIAGCDTVVTFEPHPLAVLTSSPPLILSPLPHKLRLLRSLGVREVVLIDFTRTRAGQPAADFVDEVLVDKLCAAHVSVGANFRYGRGAAGSPETLEADGRFEVRVEELLCVDGEPVSSSRIRHLVASGELGAAAALLGSPVHVSATVHRPLLGSHFEVDGALLRLAPEGALPPTGSYRCAVGGESATLTLTRAPGRGLGFAGWLSGHAVEIRPGARLEIDVTGDGIAEEPAAPPAFAM